jgi:hypothetical protein
LICLPPGWRGWTFPVLVSNHVQWQNLSNSEDDNGDEKHQNSICKMHFFRVFQNLSAHLYELEHYTVPGHTQDFESLTTLLCRSFYVSNF